VNARPHARDPTLTTLLLPHSAALYCRCLCPAALRALRETRHYCCSSSRKSCPSRWSTSSCIPSRCSPVCTRYPLRRALTLWWSKRQVSRTQCHMQAQTLLVLQCWFGSHGGQPEAGLLRTPSAERLRDASTTWWRRDPRRGVSASRQSASHMLRSAFARALGRVAIQCQSWVVQPGAVQQPPPQWLATHGLTTSAARRGIEDFLDAQRKPGEYPKAGTSSGQSGPLLA
jgi:hypothetical protein